MVVLTHLELEGSNFAFVPSQKVHLVSTPQTSLGVLCGHEASTQVHFC